MKLLFTVFIFVVLLFTTAANAQAPTPEASVSAIVKYDLAFPGILPDHPLYKLKVLRDKIVAVITNEPEKKIEFYLRQTDKGILASAMLVDKNKVDLAAETALKAEHNYTLLTQQLYRLDQLPDQAFFDNLEKAALKHQEVLTSVGMRVPEDKRQTFFLVADFSKRNWEAVQEYKKIQEELEAELEEPK